MRFGTALVPLMLLLRASGSAAAPPGSSSLDALLAHVRAASGAPYASHIVSTRKDTEDGRSVVMRTESEGYRSLVRRCQGDICAGEYFDGLRSFDVNINDTALPRDLHRDDEARIVRAITTCAFASPEFRASGGSVSEMSPVVRNTKTYRRIVVEIGEAAFRLSIDPTTWLPVEASTPDARRTFAFSDFRKVGRLTLPFRVRRDGAVVERYEDRHVATGPLVAPPGLNPTFAQAVSPQPMIRLERQQANEPVVPCKIGGVAVNCLLDTGNSSLGISLELSEQLGLEASGDYEISGIGRYLTGIVTAGPLSVGSATFPTARYVVLHDLHDYGYDVVLGADFFARSRVTIDYGRRSVTIASPDRAGSDALIPLRFENMVPLVGVQLGAFDVPLAIDTGDEATINLWYDYYLQHPGLFEVRSRRQVAGIGGSAEQIVGNLPSLRIATFEVTQQAIAATRAPEPAASGHLGSGFLSHFSVILDYAHARLGLVPHAGDSSVHETP